MYTQGRGEMGWGRFRETKGDRRRYRTQNIFMSNWRGEIRRTKKKKNLGAAQWLNEPKKVTCQGE